MSKLERDELADTISAFIAAIADGITNREATTAIMVAVDEYALSRSGDSALVEAVGLLTEVSNGVPGRENELLAEIDKFIQQHGERE